MIALWWGWETPRGLTRISREACCRVIGIKMANGASIKGLTDFRLLSRAHAVGPPRRVLLFPRFFVAATTPHAQAENKRVRDLGTGRYEISIARPEKFSIQYPHRQRYSCVCVCVCVCVCDGSSFGYLNSREVRGMVLQSRCAISSGWNCHDTSTARHLVGVGGWEEETNKGTNERTRG